MSDDIISLYRARLAREKGAVKKEWGGRLSIALIYPNHYRIGMSNLGFQIVYHLFNNRSKIVAERVFLPEGREMSHYIQSGKQLLSLETQTPVQNFDLVAFSLSFENDYLNILKILELAKIPLLAAERSDHCPLVMAGGITAFLNPEPLADFIDFFLLGEAEANLNKFIDVFLEFRGQCATRAEALRALAGYVPSLYVPSLYQLEYYSDGTLKSFSPTEDRIPEKVQVARYIPEADMDMQVPFSVVTTPDTEFGNKVLIELARGCGRSCRFCAAGYVYRPPRVHPAKDIRKSVLGGIEKCGEVGLVAAAVSDIPGIEELTSVIIKNGGLFSVSSLRADSITRGLLDNLKQVGQRTVSIAPEAGSERLRRVINKHLTREQIIEAVRLISGVDDFAVRLYFLVGLPTETSNDIAELIDLVKIIKHHMVKEAAPRGKMGQIRLSVNCFVPKASTPFQWAPLENMSSLREKQKRIKKVLVRQGGVKVNFDVPKWAYVQTLLSMGNRRVGSILLMAHKLDGNWTKALRFSDVNPDFFVYRPKGLDEVLPWDFIDNGISKEHLIGEYKLALKEEESAVCHVGECNRCGVCGHLEKSE